MKKTAIFPVLISISLLSFLHVSQSSADSTVSVSNNGDGSSSHVSVYNSTSTNYSNTSVSTNNSRSTVTITCNGKTYTYESNGEAIDANPCDGSHVKINNNGTSASSDTGHQSVLGTDVTPYPTLSKEQIDQKNAELKKKMEDEKAKIKATITAMPRPTITPVRHFSFDLGAWLRSLFASIFK